HCSRTDRHWGRGKPEVASVCRADAGCAKQPRYFGRLHRSTEEEGASPNYSNPCREAAGWRLPARLPRNGGRSRPRGGTPHPFPPLGKAPQRAVQRISRTDEERELGGEHAGARTPGDTSPHVASSPIAAPRSAASARRLPRPP